MHCVDDEYLRGKIQESSDGILKQSNWQLPICCIDLLVKHEQASITIVHTVLQVQRVLPFTIASTFFGQEKI